MGTVTQEISSAAERHAARLRPARKQPSLKKKWPLPHIALLLGLWFAIFVGSLSTPALLDDADATHAQAAQAMSQSGDWVTLHVNGMRYLEKAPLPYWIVAASLWVFQAQNPAHGAWAAFAIHLPLALTVLALAWLGYVWSRRAFGSTAALYTGIFVLTSAGVFLFTRIFIPDAMLSLWLALALWGLLRAFEARSVDPAGVDSQSSRFAYMMWASLALAVLSKGLVAIVFFFGAAALYLLLTGDWRNVRQLRPVSGVLLFLVIAAPWHVLAGLRNSGGAEGHGFFWFYFVNEHVLRFLGQRIPRDFNKLPAYLYWLLHGVWLFPWSFLAPAAALFAWRGRHEFLAEFRRKSSRDLLGAIGKFGRRTILLLLIFSGLVLVFFSFSTNQEYYTFPVYLPLLMLLAAALAAMQQSPQEYRRALSLSYGALAVFSLAVAGALGVGLWNSRHMAFVSDIGGLLAHRGIGNYTLSMSHLFDLTGPSFAALRLPAGLAAIALAAGPIAALVMHLRRKQLGVVITLALTSATFLIAAHIALVRFAPMLSSRDFAMAIQRMEDNGSIGKDSEVMIYGDQAFGSSIPFYLGRHVELVDGRSTSMLFGSTFADAPPIFLTKEQLLAAWSHGPRKILFVPLEQRDAVDHLLGSRQLIVAEKSGKALLTDRPLTASAQGQPTR
jgi:4-amino-4-deoxy-L-arabinose transferase-like glycosyltransferase